MELLSPEGLRQDGRRPRELRRLESRVDTLGNADGSATFELGNTKVLDLLQLLQNKSARSKCRAAQSAVRAVPRPSLAYCPNRD